MRVTLVSFQKLFKNSLVACTSARLVYRYTKLNDIPCGDSRQRTRPRWDIWF